ncbi:efflux RND transporter periplasmic adaptor subunit [Acidicapsa dinghuensis]|uniref:Efflux RND transporter periplasmic adaptor subunit n=1 Tax=Acidicapsa dinghuensis TaxID=2218256 RepID=A0ABW1EGT9_9BACT|nr:efflux RND transporter periplasmic adaptor subunit [Acidicapsa dinghuensis]
MKAWKMQSMTGVALACVMLAMAGCKKAEETPAAVAAVEAATPKVGEIAAEIHADATLSPLAQAAIEPKVTAPVEKFVVQRGDKVKQGQLLVVLENRDLSAAAMDNEGAYTSAEASYQTATKATVPEDYTRAQLDLAQAKANFDLSETIVKARTQLFAQGAIPGRDLDTAKAALVQAQSAYDLAKQHFEAVQKTSNQAALESAKGQLQSAKGKFEGAKAQLSYTEIHSPISGYVTDRPLFAGETATAGTPVITVMDTSALIAKVHVAQLLAQQLKVGGEASLQVQGADKEVPAKIALISPALDAGSTTIEVWVRIENPKNQLKAGTPVQVTMTGREVPNALLVPTSAILSSAGGAEGAAGKYVLVIGGDSTVKKRPVTVGVQTEDQTQILSGITSKDMVVTAGGFGLDEGTKVKIGAPDKGDDDKAAGGDDK